MLAHGIVTSRKRGNDIYVVVLDPRNPLGPLGIERACGEPVALSNEIESR
jgi:hypothetical protein